MDFSQRCKKHTSTHTTFNRCISNMYSESMSTLHMPFFGHLSLNTSPFVCLCRSMYLNPLTVLQSRARVCNYAHNFGLVYTNKKVRMYFISFYCLFIKHTALFSVLNICSGRIKKILGSLGCSVQFLFRSKHFTECLPRSCCPDYI